MKYNKYYRQLDSKTVDNQSFSQNYLDGMSASQWVEYARFLSAVVLGGKVSRISFLDNNNIIPLSKFFSKIQNAR